LSSWA